VKGRYPLIHKQRKPLNRRPETSLSAQEQFLLLQGIIEHCQAACGELIDITDRVAARARKLPSGQVVSPLLRVDDQRVVTCHSHL